MKQLLGWLTVLAIGMVAYLAVGANTAHAATVASVRTVKVATGPTATYASRDVRTVTTATPTAKQVAVSGWYRYRTGEYRTVTSTATYGRVGSRWVERAGHSWSRATYPTGRATVTEVWRTGCRVVTEKDTDYKGVYSQRIAVKAVC